jgi:pyruvate/2-oxoglutarate dehydrogenase complex dihydrolipoamide acyltransferase (E2) component
MVTAKEPLKHDGESYSPGEEVTNMDEATARESSLIERRIVEVTEEVQVTDAARQLAEEEGVDLSSIDGSGKDDKVVKSDVEDAVE